jgi:hypothetical protein
MTKTKLLKKIIKYLKEKNQTINENLLLDRLKKNKAIIIRIK